jgi:predicted transcriptional regulator
VVTDRDLFIALGTRDRQPSTVTVADVMHGPLFTCSPDDEVAAVLEIMKEHAIRRVPVEGFGGTVLGIVSLNDVVLAMGRTKPALPGTAVIDTLQSICAHHQPALRIAAA